MQCVNCGMQLGHFSEWFKGMQRCPSCGKNHVEVRYHTDYSRLKTLLSAKDEPNTIWRYFDFLPLLDRKNMVSNGEGDIGTDRWTFLEEYAQRALGIDCRVYVYRNDQNPATHTFKDAGASLAASVMKENGIGNYVVASTGNVANAFAYYLGKAGISFSAFIPADALKMNGAGVSYYGQRVFRVQGDYSKAKKLAAEYAQKYNLLMTGGNTDPLRVEAKRTMVFEWLRKLPEFPTVYVQSLSGGTGPIAIEKAIREIEPLGLVKQLPRFLMVQPGGCAPMAEAWQQAKANKFPEGWESSYPVYENPVTKISTLATGNPASYPIVGSLVKKSGGDIFSFDEARCVDVVRLVAYESLVRVGPASAIALGGFFDALKRGSIKNGDVVMINIGEGIDRAPEFFEELIYTEVDVDCVDDCRLFDRSSLREGLWAKLIDNR